MHDENYITICFHKKNRNQRNEAKIRRSFDIKAYLDFRKSPRKH